MSATKEALDRHQNSLGYNCAQSILAALIAVAPTGKAQAAISAAFNEAKQDNNELLLMSSYLCNGLMYGNWPWTPYKRSELDQEVASEFLP